ncbi:MAG: alkyl hydroperoxide reductase subunit AhpF, partial [Alphaproteobacteria bacterium]
MGNDKIENRVQTGKFLAPSQKFDQHYDVVVVGYGFAGAVTAI